MTKAVISGARQRMDKTIEDLMRELTTIRTGRASVHLLDQVQVDYYGTLTPINQLATLHVPDPSLITVQPWDLSQIASLERAVRASDLGLNPSNDGQVIRIPIPALTEERRKDLAKHVGKIAEQHKVAVRNIRRDANEQLKKLLKNKEISEDDEARSLEETQSLTNQFTQKVETLAKQKEMEILEV